MPRRLGVFAHYDAGGQVKDFILVHLRALRPLCERLVFVSTAKLTDQAKAKVDEICDSCHQLPNVGYDFWMWKHALAQETEARREYDETILTNSSVFGPVGDLAAIVNRMSVTPCDYWGINESDELENRCFQSYFFGFKTSVTQSDHWKSFWAKVEPLTDKHQVILRYELGISVHLRASGFRSASAVPILYNQGRCNPTLHLTEEMLKQGCPYVKVSVLPLHQPSRRAAIVKMMGERGYDTQLIK